MFHSCHQNAPCVTAYSIPLCVNKFISFFLQVNFSTLSDIDPYYSTEVVKYLKEQLYLYALSGHMSLKESLPVVDVLPVIEENSESVENDDIFERAVEVLENRKGNIRSVIEDNILCNVSFDISEPLVENHDIELENEKLEQLKTKITNVTEDDTKSFPIFNVSEKSVFNNTLYTAQRHDVDNTDDKLPIQESQEVPTQPSSVEESIILVENVLKLSDTDVLVSSDAGSRDKCYSEGTVEKTSENEEKVLIKEEKKKLHTFRKWLTNLCCCVRKKT